MQSEEHYSERPPCAIREPSTERTRHQDDTSSSGAPVMNLPTVLLPRLLSDDSIVTGCRLERGDDVGALSDLDKAVALSGGAKGGYFVQRAKARARVAMRSNGREEAAAGVQVMSEFSSG